MNRMLWFWLVIGWIGFAILPWYQQEYGFWTLEWLYDGYPMYGDYSPAILQATFHQKFWLLPVAAFLLAPLAPGLLLPDQRLVGGGLLTPDPTLRVLLEGPGAAAVGC